MPRRITLGFASAAAALMLVIAPLPAQAADPTLNLTKISVKSIVVGTTTWGDNCRKLSVVPTLKKSKGVSDENAVVNFIQDNKIWADIRVWPGKNYMEWCPEKGFGKHVVEGEEVEGVGPGGYFSHRDNTSSSFYVRAASKASLTAKRTGKGNKQVKLTAAAKSLRFTDNYSKPVYKAYQAKKVAFQVKSGSKWKTFKTVNLSKKGAASVTVKRSSKASYRVIVPKTDSKAGVTTATVKK